MTTPEQSPGVPFLPPPETGSASPKAIAMALEDPQLIASSQVPYLPPAAPPKPAFTAPSAFDAKAMVDSTKRRVENPVYGQMPAGTPEGRAGVEAARARMRRKRRRNKVVGWVMAISFVAIVAGVGYALYGLYQDDQDEQRSEQAENSADPSDADNVSPGALTPLGEQAQVIEGMEELNSAAVASGRAAQEAINDAQQAVDQVNGGSGTTEAIAVADALPPEIAALATELQPLDGVSRYIVVLDDAVRGAPLETPGWLAFLQGLPQSPEQTPGRALLPTVGSGEIAIAVQADGDQVSRLVVLSVDPQIRVDL